MIVPLLAWPHLSTSAVVLHPEDAAAQFAIAMDGYEGKGDGMWAGCEGALLYWIGELARHLPQDGREWARWVTAWGDAYRASEMAVGPLPWWLGDTAFHLACQSQLIAGRPTHYGGWFPTAPLDIMYRMPIGENEWQTL